MSLDYGSIVAKKEGYGPIGKAGNGLIFIGTFIFFHQNNQTDTTSS